MRCGSCPTLSPTTAGPGSFIVSGLAAIPASAIVGGAAPAQIASAPAFSANDGDNLLVWVHLLMLGGAGTNVVLQVRVDGVAQSVTQLPLDASGGGIFTVPTRIVISGTGTHTITLFLSSNGNENIGGYGFVFQVFRPIP